MVTFPPGTAGLSVEAGPTAAGAAPALSLRVTGRDAAQRAAPQNRRQLKPRSAYAPGNAQPAAGGGGWGLFVAKRIYLFVSRRKEGLELAVGHGSIQT